MAFTEAQAITEVRYLLNEDSASYWSDTQLTSWIQQGVLDWSEKSLLYMLEDTVTLATDTIQYTSSTLSHLPKAVRTIHCINNNTGAAIQRVSYEHLHQNNARALGGNSETAYYFDHYNGTQLVLYVGPKPTATEDGNTLTCSFACRTTDITVIPDEYQPTIFLFAVHKAKFRERQYQEAYLYYQQYLNNITFARQDGIQRGLQPTAAFRIN